MTQKQNCLTLRDLKMNIIKEGAQALAEMSRRRLNFDAKEVEILEYGYCLGQDAAMLNLAKVEQNLDSIRYYKAMDYVAEEYYRHHFNL